MLRIFFRNSIISKRPKNPYVTGNVVGESQVFIGRTDILHATDKILSHSQQNVVVLFGEQRIGKTSVLTALKARLLDDKKGSYQPIYLNLADIMHHPLEAILNDLAKAIYTELQRLNIEEPQWNNTKNQSHDWLIELLNNQLAGRTLVLLLDEFNAVNDTKQLIREEFFHYLKSLLSIDTKRLNIVFAIGCSTIDNFEVALAFFDESMSRYHVCHFTEADTYKLIRLSENNYSLYWSKEAVKKVWELTHGHPLLTQLLCSCLWQQAWSQNPTYIPTITPQQIDSIACSGLSACKEAIEAIAALTD